jgi:hypothetical protein
VINIQESILQNACALCGAQPGELCTYDDGQPPTEFGCHAARIFPSAPPIAPDVVAEIKAGRCPFGLLREGQVIGQCPAGFPGCACMDELMVADYV